MLAGFLTNTQQVFSPPNAPLLWWAAPFFWGRALLEAQRGAADGNGWRTPPGAYRRSDEVRSGKGTLELHTVY